MKVYLVGVADCEGNSIICVCANKQIAERELFKERDRLVAEWKKMHEFLKERNPSDDMYLGMIKNISSNDYEKWNNFPQDCPYICEMNILEK